MNNSKIVIDDLNLTLEPDADNASRLRERESELVRLIDTINRIVSNSDWLTLKEIYLDRLIPSLEKQLKTESEKDEIIPSKIYRLQGKLEISKRYTDLEKLNDDFRKELVNVRLQLKNNK